MDPRRDVAVLDVPSRKSDELATGRSMHTAIMQEALPAHHQKHVVRMLKSAEADLRSRGIDPTEKTALQIFSLRAAERRKDRLRSLTAKLKRASRHT
jgi:hypothetical protein